MAYTESPWTRIAVDVGRATTSLSYVSATSTLVQNAWNYVAFTFDSAGSANELVQIYKGNRTTLATEVTYASRTDGSGALLSDATANFSIGNASGYSAAWLGTIAWFAHWNSVLTLAQVQAQQFDMSFPVAKANCVIFMHLGIHGAGGTGTQVDWSGNANHGTVSSATVGAHVPLPIFKRATTMPYKVSVAPSYTTIRAMNGMSGMSAIQIR
jgi:hypothetical protein